MDLGLKSREILAAIDRGEEVLLTYRGKEKARLVPIYTYSEKTSNKGNPLFGIWRENELVADIDVYLDSLRGVRFGAR